jgi:hypothetical protein
MIVIEDRGISEVWLKGENKRITGITHALSIIPS